MASDVADVVFHALSDATRRDILAQLGSGTDQSVSALARRYPMSRAAVQKHVAVLERAGLVEKHRRGREQLVCGNPVRLRDACALLDAMEMLWRERLARFSQVLVHDEEVR